MNIGFKEEIDKSITIKTIYGKSEPEKWPSPLKTASGPCCLLLLFWEELLRRVHSYGSGVCFGGIFYNRECFHLQGYGPERLMEILSTGGVLNGITSFLLGYSTIFSTYMAYENIPKQIYQLLLTATDNKFVMLLLINAVLL